MMHHIDPKKYPKKPELLWDKNADQQTADQMIALAKAWARSSEEPQKVN